MTDQLPAPARKRSVAVGLTAGLIGGAAAGIAFGVPAITGAADDPEPAAAGVAQAVDDSTGSDDPNGSDDRAVEAGERLREALQPLVDDGTLDADQADAVVEHLLENRPERGDREWRGGPGRFGGPGGFNHHDGPVRMATGTITDLLGLEPEELFDQLRDGASLAEVATANGVDPADLVDALVAEAEDRLDEAVDEGRLDADEAAERAAELDERISEMIERERPERDRPWGHRSDDPDPDSGTDSDSGTD